MNKDKILSRVARKESWHGPMRGVYRIHRETLKALDLDNEQARKLKAHMFERFTVLLTRKDNTDVDYNERIIQYCNGADGSVLLWS